MTASLKVIVDQVWSHTSSDHAWFQESRQDRANPTRRTGMSGPIRNQMVRRRTTGRRGLAGRHGRGSRGGGSTYLHNFLSTQPQLNFRIVMRCGRRSSMSRDSGCTLGVDGFRLDVANYYVHDAELRDNPPSGDPAPALAAQHAAAPRTTRTSRRRSRLSRKLRELMDGAWRQR